MKLTSKGQVTIPRKFREAKGLLPGVEVTFEDAPGGVLMKPASEERRNKMRAWLRKVRASANAGRSADEVMRLTCGED